MEDIRPSTEGDGRLSTTVKSIAQIATPAQPIAARRAIADCTKKGRTRHLRSVTAAYWGNAWVWSIMTPALA